MALMQALEDGIAGGFRFVGVPRLVDWTDGLRRRSREVGGSRAA